MCLNYQLIIDSKIYIKDYKCNLYKVPYNHNVSDY